jgi:CxxC motif-containing protein (DUF1111 family)
MFALRSPRRRRLRIKHEVMWAGRRALFVWRADLASPLGAAAQRGASISPCLGAVSVTAPALAAIHDDSASISRPSAPSAATIALRSATLALFLGTVSVSAPSFAVAHDDSAAINRPSVTSAPTTLPADATPIGSQPFTDHRNPPSYRKLTDAEFARYDLGMAVFNTQFVPAGTPNAGRRAGVGPLFNSTSCDSCHNNGAHGRGPTGDGPAPAPLVIQLATTPAMNPTDPEGDPVYGRVLNTIALDGVPPEGVAMIRYQETPGHYPDGGAWSLRVPHYSLTNLRYGPLSPRTLVKPRLAPALFGVGLLDAVGPGTAARYAAEPDPAAFGQARGRFGWQATALSVQDQTARAFAREMGLTSTDIPDDDCTQAETACLHAPSNGSPEVSADIFSAVVSFQRWLAVPASPTPHSVPDLDAKTFAELGCVACHQPQLALTLTDAGGKDVSAVIAPYTDLHLHDLGSRLADETVAGKKVSSKWRTAPLWGLGYRMSLEHFPTFLHDGRARSAEEAILWHDGEAAGARAHFEHLPASQRKAFLRWLETL